MVFTSNTVVEFRKDLKKALAGLEAKYNVEISMGKISYTAETIEGKLTARQNGLDEMEWKEYSGDYGFKADDFGKIFWSGTHCYKIVGLILGNKYPIKTKRDDGQEFRFTVAEVKRSGDLTSAD